ncbi:MAG: tetratricopeptide repeat protein [Gammaproteobacteria bacterium]|jgi:tetratricopeptide (TPR) repeat protein
MTRTTLPSTWLLAALLLGGCAAQPTRNAADLDALARQAASAYERDDMAQSARLYQRLTQASPEVADYWYRLGNSQARTGKPYAAIKSYSEALTREPGMTDAWYNMGLVQLQLAAKSFSAMQGHTAPGSQQYKQSEEALSGILKLIGKDAAANGGE